MFARFRKKTTDQKLNEVGHNISLELYKLFYVLLRFRLNAEQSAGRSPEAMQYIRSAMFIYLSHVSLRFFDDLTVNAVVDNTSGLLRGFPAGAWSYDGAMDMVEPREDYVDELGLVAFEDTILQTMFLYLDQLSPFEDTKQKGREVWERAQDLCENHVLQPLFMEMRLKQSGILHGLLNR